MSWKTEQDLAAIGVEYFRERGWTVYQEVAFSSRTVDFVATMGPVLHAVEVKRSRTISVLEQANFLTSFAHRVSVLVPLRGNRFFERVAWNLGIGVLCPTERWVRNEPVDYLTERVAATLRRRVATTLRRCLHDAQQTYCGAGASNGGRWSPWRDTMDRAVAFVRRNPGCTVRDIVAAESHHYASLDCEAEHSGVAGEFPLQRHPRRAREEAAASEALLCGDEMTQDLPDLTLEDDLCPDCGEMLDYWGECPNGCRQVDYDEEN